MDFLITVLPILLVLFIVVKDAWRIWKEGLFLALVKLGIALVSFVLAYFLTRLLLDPAKVDLFGLGKLVLKYVPEDFIIVMPKLEAFLRALPTALIALIGFTVFFELLRINGNKLLRKLNEKHQWSEKFLKIKLEKPLTVVVGLLIAAVCLMTDMVTLAGTLTFSGNMLYCAKTATGEKIFDTLGDVVHQLKVNPVIKLANGLGAEDMFFELTMAQRDGEPFSVGQELNDLSDAFVGILPVFEVMPKEGEIPSPEQIRALPEALSSSEDSLALTVGLVRSYREELGDSDAVLILSSLIGTTPQRFEQYLSTLTTDDAEDDLVTFCEIAAMLGDRGLIPEAGENFDLDALADPALLTEVRQEVLKNDELASFFAVSST